METTIRGTKSQRPLEVSLTSPGWQDHAEPCCRCEGTDGSLRMWRRGFLKEREEIFVMQNVNPLTLWSIKDPGGLGKNVLCAFFQEYKMRPLPRQNWAAIGRWENGGSQLESECDSTLRLLASGSDLGGVSCKQARSLLIRRLLGCKEMKVVLKCWTDGRKDGHEHEWFSYMQGIGYS